MDAFSGIFLQSLAEVARLEATSAMAQSMYLLNLNGWPFNCLVELVFEECFGRRRCPYKWAV